MMEAWDDVNGGELLMGEVKKARGEEIEYMVNRGIWSQVPIGMCWDLTRKGPPSVRWVDVNKAGEGGMEVRCRLVARDFKRQGARRFICSSTTFGGKTDATKQSCNEENCGVRCP